MDNQHRNNVRPNPDLLLEQVAEGTDQKKRGKLKIFLGYAAGVGKTYAMLEAAQQHRNDTDVVIGVVETHGRVETEALLKGLEIIPRKKVEYRGIVLSEMDLDVILTRKPQLVLVDELAHTNHSQARHPKRYQDIEELLEAGINVYSTLNIQHIESLRNTISQITGIWVRETVPDSIIDKASELELVDIPPDDLLKRLKEGKVYVPDKIENALNEFFRKGNLIALRELTMRTTADHIDEQMRQYSQTQSTHSLQASEHLLVCIDADFSGSRIVRTARRLALQLNADWTVVHVETPESIGISSENDDWLANTFRLAEQLGARTVTLHSVSVASTIVEYAAKHNITKIVIGKSSHNHWWQKLLHRSILSQILRQNNQMDIHIVTDHGEPLEKKTDQKRSVIQRWWSYLLALGLVFLATFIGHLLLSVFDPTNILMLYILSIVITAMYLGIGPAILVSFLSVILFDLFLVPPYLSFAVEDTQYLFTFIVLMAMGILISYLAARVHQQMEAARKREAETSTLYSLSRSLTATTDMQTTISTIINNARDILGRAVVIFMADSQDKNKLQSFKENSDFEITDNEFAAAMYSFQHKKIVGHSTETLPNSRALFLPLNTTRGTIGVMGVWTQDIKDKLTLEQTRLLHAYADLSAIVIERTHLADEACNVEILQASEKLQNALLNSISHDLRTPLVSVLGVLSSLREENSTLDDAAKENLIQVASEEAGRLNHLITNLLDVSRIEADALRLNKQSSDVQDLIGTTLEQVRASIKDYQVNIDIQGNLPYIPVDFGLIVEVLVNVLDNAIKYSPANKIIDINARQIGQNIEIAIADHGVGIPHQDLHRVFDKFYRVQRPDNVAGTGLGLAISKGIVEAHNGQITAENRQGGGTIIKVILPILENSNKIVSKNNEK